MYSKNHDPRYHANAYLVCSKNKPAIVHTHKIPNYHSFFETQADIHTVGWNFVNTTLLYIEFTLLSK